jgi:UPF0716 protein FxsA
VGRAVGRTFAIGLIVAIAEVAVFIAVGHLIGWVWALLLVLAASALGGVLLRREGVRAWRSFQEVTAAGRPPGTQVLDGLVGLVGALLLAVPGLLTGLAGALVLVPPVRRLLRSGAEQAAARRLSSAAAGDLFGPRQVKVQQGAPTTSAPIEGEIVEE